MIAEALFLTSLLLKTSMSVAQEEVLVRPTRFYRIL